MVTVNYILQKLASELFIRYDSSERKYIEDKLKNFKSTLKDYFGKEVIEVLLFGSFKRDTILPRKFDENSDIDILVIFDQSKTEFTPETYRNQLRRFAGLKYFNSRVVKDHPSIVLEMQNIKFDLVPCRKYTGYFSKSLQIPDKSGSWMDTNPIEFNDQLTKANNKYNSIVKPIIRLLKCWNAYEDYPYLPFELEQVITNMSFSGDNYQTGFIYAVNNLPSTYLADYQIRKVNSLRNNIAWVEEYLARANQDKAREVIHRILGLM